MFYHNNFLLNDRSIFLLQLRSDDPVFWTIRKCLYILANIERKIYDIRKCLYILANIERKIYDISKCLLYFSKY